MGGQAGAEAPSVKLSQNATFHRMSCKGERVGSHCRGRRASPSGLVQPLGSLGGLARVYVDGLLAVLTLHGAAPPELALALGDLLDPRGVVASPAAHDLAAVGAARRLVADPARRAQGPCAECESVRSPPLTFEASPRNSKLV